MIGQTVERLDTRRNVSLAWMLPAVGLAMAGFTLDNGHLTRLALVPAAVGLAFVLSRKSRFLAHFEEDGIQIHLPKPAHVSYRRLTGLLRSKGVNTDYPFSFDVFHADGTFVIPADLNVPSIEIFDFLKSQLPDEEHMQLPSALHSFQVAQEKEFGPERVWIYRALPLPSHTTNWFWIFLCFFLFISSIAWIISGAMDERFNDWMNIGLIMFLVSLIGLFVAIYSSGSRRRGKRTSVGGLVISPIGFALQKSDLLGKMRWDEITCIYLQGRDDDTLIVEFRGGKITLRDIYNKPINDIYRRLRDSWRGPPERD